MDNMTPSIEQRARKAAEKFESFTGFPMPGLLEIIEESLTAQHSADHKVITELQNGFNRVSVENLQLIGENTKLTAQHAEDCFIHTQDSKGACDCGLTLLQLAAAQATIAELNAGCVKIGEAYKRLVNDAIELRTENAVLRARVYALQRSAL